MYEVVSRSLVYIDRYTVRNPEDGMPILPHLPIWLHSDWSFITMIFLRKQTSSKGTNCITHHVSRSLAQIYIYSYF